MATRKAVEIGGGERRSRRRGAPVTGGAGLGAVPVRGGGLTAMARKIERWRREGENGLRESAGCASQMECRSAAKSGFRLSGARGGEGGWAERENGGRERKKAGSGGNGG